MLSKLSMRSAGSVFQIATSKRSNLHSLRTMDEENKKKLN